MSKECSMYGMVLNYGSKLDKGDLKLFIESTFKTKKTSDYKIVVANDDENTVVVVKTNVVCFGNNSRIKFDGVVPTIKKVKSVVNWNNMIDRLSSGDNEAKRYFDELGFKIGETSIVTLWDWQEKLKVELNEMDDVGKIIWICGSKIGKLFFCKHMNDGSRFRYINNATNELKLLRLLRMMIKDGWREHCLLVKIHNQEDDVNLLMKQLIDYKANGLSMNRCEDLVRVVVFSSKLPDDKWAGKVVVREINLN